MVECGKVTGAEVLNSIILCQIGIESVGVHEARNSWKPRELQYLLNIPGTRGSERLLKNPEAILGERSARRYKVQEGFSFRVAKTTDRGDVVIDVVPMGIKAIVPSDHPHQPPERKTVETTNLLCLPRV